MSRWRLPTIQELLSVVDSTKCNLATSLKSSKTQYYWVNSPNASDPSYAWCVFYDFRYGNYYNKNNSAYVKCVRTLKDGSLEWVNEDATNKMTWDEAMNYAESLNNTE